jgi:hypothetical protein
MEDQRKNSLSEAESIVASAFNALSLKLLSQNGFSFLLHHSSVILCEAYFSGVEGGCPLGAVALRSLCIDRPTRENGEEPFARPRTTSGNPRRHLTHKV